ncbi:hypothetical protein [Microbacterium hominis]|uniref:hypothetical protein n=1 Tax=Microbacterium hominis TaxID=162426 RepID=UPI000A9966A5|nr:hypothetical protein [Microbacterium hominis]
MRESAEEAVLVVAASTDLDVILPSGALIGVDAARPLYGAVRLDADPSGAVRLRGTGASFAAWALPGVDAPAARATSAESTPEAFAQLGGPEL